MVAKKKSPRSFQIYHCRGPKRFMEVRIAFPGILSVNYNFSGKYSHPPLWLAGLSLSELEWLDCIMPRDFPLKAEKFLSTWRASIIWGLCDLVFLPHIRQGRPINTGNNTYALLSRLINKKKIMCMVTPSRRRKEGRRYILKRKLYFFNSIYQFGLDFGVPQSFILLIKRLHIIRI